MKINDIFKIPVYETQLGLDVEQMKRYCLLHEIDNETRELSNAGGYQPNNLNGEFPDLNDLFVEINEHANNFSKTLQLGKCQLDNVWINVNRFGHYNKPHIHGECVISGVYYIATPENCGNIEFKHPSAYWIDVEWKPHANNNYNSAMWTMPSVADTLYLFPPWLTHSVQPSQNKNEPRVSISFNMELDKRVVL